MFQEQNNKLIFSWGHERRFNAYSNYIKNRFGGRVQKVSVDAGFTCPNRDGTKGVGGCTYCNNDAFNPSYCVAEKSVSLQIEEGIEFHRQRYRKASSYFAYFQAYSNTYASAGKLRELYEKALSYPCVTGLIIGTRPDCINAEKLDYLEELSRRCYLAVEFGIESCYNRTLERINRGHSFEDAVDAVRITASRGINTSAHLIFGLPGETREEMMAEAEIISGLPLHTVKFHQLQIIKGTAMEIEFRKNKADFCMFTWNDYLDFIIRFLERLNPSIMVERFTGEAPPRFLTGEVWGKKRTDQIMNLIEKRLMELDTWQGKYYKVASPQTPPPGGGEANEPE
jgi:radical SAM protein (TIGR01212 family)